MQAALQTLYFTILYSYIAYLIGLFLTKAFYLQAIFSLTFAYYL